MTVSTSTSTASYTANGSTTTFAYPFRIFADGDLVVILRNTATAVETVQVLNSNYTVTGAGSNAGGNVVFGVAPPAGNTVFIRRELPLTQEVDYVPNDPFPADTHEAALDKLTMLVQQTGIDTDRAVLFPQSDVALNLTNVLPPVAERSNKVLGFKVDGGITTSTNTLSQFDAAVSSFVNATGNNAASIFYDPAGSGAQQTTVQSKLRETISVKDFGAVGDGITDDTAAFVNAWAASNPQSVFVPKGAYLVTGSISGNFFSNGGASILGGFVNLSTEVVTNYNWMGFFGTWQNGPAFKVRTGAREIGGSGATFARIGLVDDDVTMLAVKGVYQPSAIRIQRNNLNTLTASATMVMNLTQVETKPLLGKNICLQLHALKSSGFTGSTINVRLQYSKEPQQPIVASDGNYTNGNTVLAQSNFTLTETMTAEENPYFITGTLPADAVQVAIVVTVPWAGTAGADDFVDIEGCFLTIGNAPASVYQESFESLLTKAKTRYQTTYPYLSPRGVTTKAGSLRTLVVSTDPFNGVAASVRFDPPMAIIPQVLMQSPLSGTENRWENETTGVFASGLINNISDQGATFQNNGALTVGDVLLCHWTARCVF